MQNVCAIEPITLVLDLIGLVLISLPLFSIPKPIEFTFSQDYGVIGDLKPVADAINSISRNIALIKRMRYGFYILLCSFVLKLINWVLDI